jgi:hypothetical protein
MKTGLITFHFAHHYGAQLQAYALMRAIRNIGADCEIIDYRLLDSTKASRLFQGGFSPITVLRNLHTLAHYAPLKLRDKRFREFVSDNMTVGAKRYSCYQDLLDNPPYYDTYVCGSDQIWNPFIFENKRFDPSFFLAFAKDKPLASYAPSFGETMIPEDMYAELTGYLSAFSHISVREKRGADMIKKITELDAQVTLDPTLLLNGNEWGSLARADKQRKPYTLCYFISDPGGLAMISADMGRQAVQLAGTRRRIAGANELVFNAGPREFLGLFQNADFVLTNSFHGTVFSILFNKPFICGVCGEHKRESRLGNLLGTLGLLSRLDGDMSPIDYTEANRLLKEEREKSMAFLRTALNY